MVHFIIFEKRTFFVFKNSTFFLFESSILFVLRINVCIFEDVSFLKRKCLEQGTCIYHYFFNIVSVIIIIPAGIYLFKINNRKNQRRCDIC